MSQAPFGIVFGSPPPALFEDLGNGVAAGTSPPSPHTTFSQYFVVFGNNCGVARIVASSEEFLNDSYGSLALRAFDKVEGQLTAKYGRPKQYKFLKLGATWNEDQYWTNSIVHNERVHVCYWGESLEGPVLPDPLATISLEFSPTNFGQIQLKLTYDSVLWREVVAEMEAAEAESL